MEIATIGFAQRSARHFFERLQHAAVKRLLDIHLNNVSQLAGFAKAGDLPYFLDAIAGIDVESGKRIRPVGSASLPGALLATRGGPFDTGRIIDLGADYPAPSPPEVEDVRVNVSAIGLSRAFAARPGEDKRHWLQLNNLHLLAARSWQYAWDGRHYVLG